MENRLLIRTKMIIPLIIVITVVFVCNVFHRASVMKGLSPDADEMKKKIETYLKYSDVTEGNIKDRKGQLLSEATHPGETGKLLFPKQYSWLLGYIGSSTYEDSNLAKEKEQIKNYYSLKGEYIDYLYKPGAKKGVTLHLTIDNDTQLQAYSRIKNRCASVVVMEYKTGKIRCLANSQPVEYNANDNSNKQWNEIKNINGFFVPNYLNAKEPGSVFKVVTAAAMIENHKQNLKYSVKPSQRIAGHDVRNVGSGTWNNMSLEQALGYSVNTYFGQAALDVGGLQLGKVAKRFKLNQSLELDFTTIKSVFDLEDFDEDLVVDASYGQGKTVITPINLAMIYQAIANKGKMSKPYLIERITHKGADIKYKKKHKSYKPISKITAGILKSMLKKNVDYYYGKTNKVANLHAKTGTAQITGDYKYRKTIASFDSKYVIVITEDSNEGYGIDLWDDLISIYKSLY